MWWWWHHQMETFSALLAICAGNSLVPSEFPTQRPVTRSFDVFFDLHPNKRLSKQWWCRWFEMPQCPLWRHRNDNFVNQTRVMIILFKLNRHKITNSTISNASILSGHSESQITLCRLCRMKYANKSFVFIFIFLLYYHLLVKPCNLFTHVLQGFILGNVGFTAESQIMQGFDGLCSWLTLWVNGDELMKGHNLNQRLTHLSLEKITAILQTTFLYAFLWMKNFVFQFKFHCFLFLRVQLTLSQ